MLWQTPSGEDRTRQRILEELRVAGQTDMDAEVKTKQAEAKRAELLFRLKQNELQAGGLTPQPLGRQVGPFQYQSCL